MSCATCSFCLTIAAPLGEIECEVILLAGCRRYRMHVNLEDMVEDWQFTDQIYSMLAESGRGCVVHDAQNHISKDHSKNR